MCLLLTFSVERIVLFAGTPPR